MNHLPQRLILVVFASTAGLLSIGQLIPSDTGQIAAGETLPQILLWLVAWVVLVLSLLLSGSLQTLSLSGRRLVEKDRLTSSVGSRESFHASSSLLNSMIGAMLFTILWVFLAAWHSFGTGNFRFAVNAWWQWVAWFATFFLIVRLSQIGNASRAFRVWMIALCFLVCVHSVYQVMVSLPADRERFRNDPQAVLAEAGIEATPGSATYMLFEGRLQDSSPTGPFALTNSLAGFLLPWLVILFAHGLEAILSRKSNRQPGFIGWMIAILMAWVLVMTKSRSAWIALGVGCLICIVFHPRIARQLRRLLSSGVLVTSTIVIICVSAVYAWDRKVVLETPQSLQYRIEYWKTAIAMAGDNLWFGVGPGNFQTRYSSYKIPESSETVADPHQFFLETLATSGLPAFLGLLVVILLAVFIGIRKWIYRFNEANALESPVLDSDAHSGSERSRLKIHQDGTLHTESGKGDGLEIDKESKRNAAIAIYVGGMVGLICVWFSLGALGPVPMAVSYWLGIPIVCGYLIWEISRDPAKDVPVDSVREGARQIESSLSVSSDLVVGVGPAVIALLIHLLASGGWMTPGVGNSLAVLLAIWFVDTSGRKVQAKIEGSLALKRALGQQTKDSFQSWVVAIGAVFPLLLLLVFYYSTWLPTQKLKVIQGRLLDGQIQMTSNRLEEYIASDPWDPTPVRFVADRAYRDAVESLSRRPVLQAPENLQSNPLQSNPSGALISSGSQVLAIARRYAAEYRAKDRYNWQVWLQSGYWELEVAAFHFDSLALSLDHFREASRLSPSDLGILTQVALVAWIADEITLARASWDQAGELNQRIVHVDRKLFGARVYWPASVGPKSTRIGPTIWKKARDEAASGASVRTGWVRAEPVFEFLRTQLTGPGTERASRPAIDQSGSN